MNTVFAVLLCSEMMFYYRMVIIIQVGSNFLWDRADAQHQGQLPLVAITSLLHDTAIEVVSLLGLPTQAPSL